MNMRKMGICLAGVASVIVLVACGGQAPVDEDVPRIRPAKLLTVAEQGRTVTISLPALIDASLTSDLTFERAGRIEELNVVDGQLVDRGAVIARLNQRDARSQLNTARTQLNQAQTEFERAQRLIDENAIARSIYDQRQTALDVAQDSLQLAQKALEDTVIRAPFSGVAAVVYVEQFENVGPDQRVLTLQTTGDAEAIIQVPARIIANQGFIEAIESFIELDAAPGVRVPSTVHSIATVADSDTQTFRVALSFSPPEGVVILPGMSGTATAVFALLDEEEGVPAQSIRVPLSAIQADGETTFVWLVDPETMSVSRQIVAVETRPNDAIDIVDGLSPGDVIVAAGAAFLNEGVIVRPYEN